MAFQILGMFANVFGACVDWATELFIKTDMSYLILSVVILSLVVSLLIVPIRGSSRSKISQTRDLKKGD